MKSLLKTKTEVTATALHQLLVSLSEHQRSTCFRFRVLGELWYPSFARIININSERVILLNEKTDRLISVNLSLIVQFEIDIGFQNWSPNFHYDVTHHMDEA